MTTLRSLVRENCDKHGVRGFEKLYKLPHHTVDAMLYKNQDMDATRATAILSSLGYQAPLDPIEHLSNLLHTHTTGMTLIKLADEAGFTDRALSHWKAKERKIKWFPFRTMCEVLKCPIVSKLPY